MHTFPLNRTLTCAGSGHTAWASTLSLPGRGPSLILPLGLQRAPEGARGRTPGQGEHQVKAVSCHSARDGCGLLLAKD